MLDSSYLSGGDGNVAVRRQGGPLEGPLFRLHFQPIVADSGDANFSGNRVLLVIVLEVL